MLYLPNIIMSLDAGDYKESECSKLLKVIEKLEAPCRKRHREDQAWVSKQLQQNRDQFKLLKRTYRNDLSFLTNQLNDAYDRAGNDKQTMSYLFITLVVSAAFNVALLFV
jgi:hypothetical protein